jgi:hypothetical protein
MIMIRGICDPPIGVCAGVLGTLRRFYTHGQGG